jgi:hypothetical protein
LVIARRTSSFAARRLGGIAAAAPASPARTTMITRLNTGMLNTVMPWFFMASTRAQPKNTPTCRPRNAPCSAMMADSHRIVARSYCLVMPGLCARAGEIESRSERRR